MTGSQEAHPDAPPLSVVALALSLGVLLVGGTTAGGYLLMREQSSTAAAPSEPAPSEPAPSMTTASTPEPQGLPPAQSHDWRTRLADTPCIAPCAGGTTCSTKSVECTSGFACVPGTGAERFGDHELWSLHLSAVQEVDAAGYSVDPCDARKDFWVCRRGTSECVSQADACANAGRGTAPIAVTGAELDHGGVTLDVHLGGPAGPLVAATAPIRNLRRGGLCRGFSAKATGGAVAKVTYFVRPR
jgi:hypothetical protein